MTPGQHAGLAAWLPALLATLFLAVPYVLAALWTGGGSDAGNGNGNGNGAGALNGTGAGAVNRAVNGAGAGALNGTGAGAVNGRPTARARRWSPWRIASWLAGCAVLGLALSPLVPHGDVGLMVRHLLLGMFAPLGLIMAAPVTLLLRVAPRRLGRRLTRLLRTRVVHVLTHPVTAALVYVGGLYVVTLTPLSAASLANPRLHHLVDHLYLASGCLFTWAVAGPDPAPHRPGVATRVAVLIGAAAAHGWLAKHLYATVPGFQEAAQVMYYGGDVAELLLAVALFAAWYRRAGHRRPSPVPA
ncbi:cytochrome c oxidase assembly protein [Nonomuraea muscovyensis]|uniref:Putative membrane protein n=1 Tax=Nonomuraea muscovyensis TaxID=1124761 RepID=A0A7X0C1R5_9ACTN|nr:cytochrome c oxidase assembly protein [Nonomuraea muscovyensis]MBB6346828.1 putative membrane protein [Nonomuraea muscovyensis]